MKIVKMFFSWIEKKKRERQYSRERIQAAHDRRVRRNLKRARSQ